MKQAPDKPIFLFSIDLEDELLALEQTHSYTSRVIENTHTYLDWLEKNNSTCTFFVVGNIAKKYPTLIKDIYKKGHEIACHTSTHITLDKHNKESFKTDLEENILAITSCGVPKPIGFRAPVFSLTKETSWAYEVLQELGFTYSSSILPAKNPLFGWKEFGEEPKVISSGLLEIPMTIDSFGPLSIPFSGGVYFRVLPFYFISSKFKKRKSCSSPILGYFHPYDVDNIQEKFMMPGINNSRFYNFLMYYNRKKTLPRLTKILKKGFQITTYKAYVDNHYIP